MSFGMGNALTSQVPPDIEVAEPPADSISALAFCPVADYLAAASWNGEVSEHWESHRFINGRMCTTGQDI